MVVRPVDDAAEATVTALGRAASGIYNIVDDDPAPYAEWVSYYAKLTRAAPPRRLPRWLARVAAGPAITAWATERAGVSNAKAKSELRWHPKRESWRRGFTELLNER